MRIRDIAEMFKMPLVTVSLLFSQAAGNDDFYKNLVMEFYAMTQLRHPKLPLVKKFEHGVAMCRLPKTFDEYFMMIEASGRRNYKKSQRNHYVFSLIDYNSFLADIQEIRRSAVVRQGPMPVKYIDDEVKPCSNPVSKARTHDYRYFGVLQHDKLVAYAACFINGEICLIEQIFGHCSYEKDGVVPMMIIDMANYVIDHYPDVKYYAYGMFFGARPSMRRFLKKFRFSPHRVRWVLDNEKIVSLI